MRPQSSVGFGEKKFASLKIRIKHVSLSYWSEGNAGTHFNETTGARIVVDSGASMHMMSKKRIKLRRDGHGKKVQNPNRSVDCKRKSAHPRGGTSVRPWLESVRNRATTRRNASCPIARQALIKTTDTPVSGSAVKSHDWPQHYLQDRQFCTSCRSQVICQSRKKFVFNYPITRIAGTRGSSSIWEESGGNLIFRFSIRVKWRNLLGETWAGIWRNDKKEKNDSLADMPFRLDFTDNLIPIEVHAPAHISQDSDPEHSTKVWTKSWKHSIFTHCPKDRNCDVWWIDHGRCPGRWARQGRSGTGCGGPARVPNLRVCCHPFLLGGTRQEREVRDNTSCRGTI